MTKRRKSTGGSDHERAVRAVRDELQKNQIRAKPDDSDVSRNRERAAEVSRLP
jgi:hypothetical protein